MKKRRERDVRKRGKEERKRGRQKERGEERKSEGENRWHRFYKLLEYTFQSTKCSLPFSLLHCFLRRRCEDVHTLIFYTT